MPTLQLPTPSDDGKALVYSSSLGKFVPTAIAVSAVTPTGGGKETVVTANTGSAYTINLANGNLFDLTINAATAALTFSGATNGVLCSVRVWLHQDAVGGRLFTLPASVKWDNGQAPSVGTAANEWSTFTFETINGGTLWVGYLGATRIS